MSEDPTAKHGVGSGLRTGPRSVSLASSMEGENGITAGHGAGIMTKILMITGDAGEAQEIYYAKYPARGGGVAGQDRRPGEARLSSRSSTTSSPASTPIPRSRDTESQADLGLDDVVADEYDGLVLPGGRAPEYLRNREKAVSHRPALPRDRQADRGQLSRAALDPGGRRRPWPDNDRLPRARARPPQLAGPSSSIGRWSSTGPSSRSAAGPTTVPG